MHLFLALIFLTFSKKLAMNIIIPIIIQVPENHRQENFDDKLVNFMQKMVIF